jgi:hypothetical protein
MQMKSEVDAISLTSAWMSSSQLPNIWYRGTVCQENGGNQGAVANALVAETSALADLADGGAASRMTSSTGQPSSQRRL